MTFILLGSSQDTSARATTQLNPNFCQIGGGAGPAIGGKNQPRTCRNLELGLEPMVCESTWTDRQR